MRILNCLCPCFRQKIVPKDIVEVQVSAPEQIVVSSPKANEKVIIESKFTKEDVKISEFTPSSTQKFNFSYNCPICLRYFSTILALKCCKQYICHFCLDDLKNKELKFEIACPHCKSTPIHAIDVDFNSSVKKYFDSPYGTFGKSQNKIGNQWVPMPVVDEGKDLDEKQESVEEISQEPNLRVTV